MRSYIIGVLVVALLVSAPFLLQVKQHLRDIQGGPARKLFLICVYLTFLSFPVYLLADSVSEQFFGLKLPPIHSFFGKKNSIDQGKTDALQTPQISLTYREVCGRALGANGWLTNLDAQQYVRQARENGETIDSCRLKLGLRTLKDQEAANEVERIRSHTNIAICQTSLESNRSEFTSAQEIQLYVAEALRRELTPHACWQLISGAPTLEPHQATSRLSSKNISTIFDPRSGLPVSVISNASSSFANMRAGPGKTFKIVSRLPNGIEVMIYGPALSQSGSEWCSIATGDGKRGYVSADFLADACELTADHLENVQKMNRAEAEEAAKLAAEFLKMIGNVSRR